MKPESATAALAATVIVRDLGSEVVVLDTATSQYFISGGIGADLLRQLCAGASLEAAAETIAAECDAPRARVIADLETFIGELRREGLLV